MQMHLTLCNSLCADARRFALPTLQPKGFDPLLRRSLAKHGQSEVDTEVDGVKLERMKHSRN